MMNGALNRIRRERGLVWDGAMLPYYKKRPSRAEFVGRSAAKAEPAEFLDLRLRGSVRGMKGISLADYRRARLN